MSTITKALKQEHKNYKRSAFSRKKVPELKSYGTNQSEARKKMRWGLGGSPKGNIIMSH